MWPVVFQCVILLTDKQADTGENINTCSAVVRALDGGTENAVAGVEISAR